MVIDSRLSREFFWACLVYNSFHTWTNVFTECIDHFSVYFYKILFTRVYIIFYIGPTIIFVCILNCGKWLQYQHIYSLLTLCWYRVVYF